MDTTSATAHANRRDWKRAWHALVDLYRDSERTDRVFDLIDALDGPTDAAAFRDFASQPEGRQLLAERPCLLDTLSDHENLRRLPEGSLGRAYLDFMQKAGLNARDLVDAETGSTAESTQHRSEEQRWLGDRGRDSHDLWHVLTGYGRDEAGEVALLAFTYANYRSLGIAAILLLSLLVGPKTLRFQWERYLWQAYRRGVKADLDFARYEEWLALPLAEARRRAAIAPPEEAHPELGIVEASRESGSGLALLRRI